jgi:hypothetical protein
MKRAEIVAMVGKLLLMPIATVVNAGVSGDSETRLLIDSSRFGDTQTSLEQWNSLYYKDLSSGLDMGLQFALEADEESGTGQLYQCFIQSDIGDEWPQITMGRFEMIDSLGFNTLDGISISQQVVPFTWKLYTGKPRRFEAEWEEDADLLLGLSADYSLMPLIQSDYFRKLIANVGLERRWSHTRQMNLHLSLVGERPEIDEDLQLNDFSLAADMDLDDQTLRRVVIDSHYDLKQQGDLRLVYRFYRPDEEPETFRDRFHGFYSMDRQSIFKGVWSPPKIGVLESHFEFTGSRQQQGDGGLGLAGELIYPTGYGPVVDGRADFLETGDDYATSLYLRYRQPISSLSKIEVEGVYQMKQTRLSGGNHLKGLAFLFAQRIFSQLTLNVSGEWLNHSERDDEYRLAASIRYEFFQTNIGELP